MSYIKVVTKTGQEFQMTARSDKPLVADIRHDGLLEIHGEPNILLMPGNLSFIQKIIAPK